MTDLRVLVLETDNLVERPWGGRRLLEYKGLEVADDRKYGEAFEVAAFPADGESSAFPSRVRVGGGDPIELTRLLETDGPELLGEAHLRAHGPVIPLLPKTLDVVELLSVQAHPPGQLELYVVIDAEPGATARLGFRQDVDAPALEARLLEGRRTQEALLATLRPGADPSELQAVLAPRLAHRESSGADLFAAVGPLLGDSADAGAVTGQLQALHALYWSTLDLLNEIPLTPGLVILNATPLRLAGDGPRSAEIHALGSPERRESLMLEIRRPGITLRAWDNVRFPLRHIEVSDALAAANLRATRPEELLVEPEPVAGAAGVYRLLESEQFNVYSLRPRAGAPVTRRTGGRPHTLHAIAGEASVAAPDGVVLASLRAGQSAIVAASVDEYALAAAAGEPQVIQVEVPESG